MAGSTTAGAADSINVVEIVRATRRGWRALVLCTVLGAAAGTAVLLYAPRRFASSASIVVRTNTSSGAGSMLARLGLGDAAPILPGGSSGSTLETESAILASRGLVGGVIDSLRLQAAVSSPRSVASRSVIASLRLAPAFKRAKYLVEKTAGGQYRWTAGDAVISAAPGQPVQLPQGAIVLRGDTALPARMVVQLRDHEDALIDVSQRLSVSKTTGSDVLTIGYQAPDSATAAAVPNLLVADYFARRHTVDRGTNEYRAAFLAAQIDTVSRALRLAEDSLRRFQEATGVVQPDVQGKLQYDRAADLREQLATVDLERGALNQLTAQIASGKMTPRQLAAYPTFLKSPAINDLLGQLVKVETDRTELLERRLENDNQVVALAQSAKNIENQLTALATSYGTSLEQQRTGLSAQLDTLTRALGAFPGALESSGRLQRHVKELGTTYQALQGQLVEARLGAIGEGGDARLLDLATPSKKPVFPRLLTTTGVGTALGLAIGAVLALFTGLMSKYVDDPLAIERTTGVPALQLDSALPLVVAGNHLARTLLLVPVDGRVSTAGVAERLARTAIARGSAPTVLDLSISSGSRTSALTTDVSTVMHRLEQENATVIVRLPSLGSVETAAALHPDRPVVLVAPAGRLDRRMLADAVQTLRRLEVPCAGVVVNRSTDGARA